MTPTSSSYTIPARLTGADNNQTINPSELNLWRVIKKNDDGTVDVVSEYVSNETVTFKGRTGYINYIGVLNQIAAQYTNPKYVQNTRHIGYNGQTEYITDTSKIDSETAPWLHRTDNINSESSGLGNEYENVGGGDIMFTDYLMISEVCDCAKSSLPSGEKRVYFLASRYYNYDEQEGQWKFGGRVVIESGAGDGNFLWKSGEPYMGDREIAYSIRPVLTLKPDLGLKNGDGKSAETAYTFE